ncbi:PVC-type heme-binding CxxCH protein [Limnoglobus roseus]|uniref:Putative beta-propeller-type and TIM-barrel-type glycoside hydrolase n=1 Tax=Limnoglobus roseus TaxID=2598579 RepID=A0A5C1AQW8_9BACT|nr:PVC-type heme-binding CxxCH protein [Limnoglobus roseus]QEL20122.1 putative beta-propeller-type and TIM-barrel-type glycoside hydrolase [Limnoglobus roseus]
MRTLSRRSVPVLAALLMATFSVTAADSPRPTRAEVLAATLKPYTGPTTKGVDTSTLTGKVVCGYQGWFTCAGDKADRGWVHWSRDRKDLRPGAASFDLWPDVSELPATSRYATSFKLPDGKPAEVFSSHDQTTVLKHFEWMRDYGIDGVFVQRFITDLRDPLALRHNNTVLGHCREGANRNGRGYSVMYDLSGLRVGRIDEVIEDWKTLRTQMKVTDDPAYFRHRGKPIVTVWGVGFNDNRSYTLAECKKLVEFLKADGCTVMLGVPTYFREQKNDTVRDKELHDVLALADILSPWTVGRYGKIEEVNRYAERTLKPDVAWCREKKLDFMPVAFPGFSWHNLKKGAPVDQISRQKGAFLWSQFAAIKKAGAEMAYVAMFDEVDEGTAIFKCTNTVPTGDGMQFATLDGVPSDHYLRLTGQGAKMIRGEIPADAAVPAPQTPVATKPADEPKKDKPADEPKKETKPTVKGELPKCPPDWKVEVVAAPPRLVHPSVVCCAPDGRIFVAEDPMDMGADSTKPTDRILCIHPDGKITVFAENLHAVFGLAYIDGKVYVHHCPKFSVFTDDHGVGKDHKILIETTNPRPNTGFNDHIPSNIRLGMDGWLYMSTGDKGIYGATGTDGSKAEIRGGGVLRLRPDGTHLEVYSTGTRNHLDVAINAEDEIFTYDNTDDGNGWWTRVTHMVDGGKYGYPWDYKPRQAYTLWMMTDYGGGSPTGALAYNEDALPAKYRGNLFLCEWARKQLLRVTVERDGGSYKVVGREDFLTSGSTEFRPVGIAVSPDGMSLYVADWNYGGWKQNVTAGRLLKVTYTGGPSLAAAKPAWYIPAAMGQKFEATATDLVEGLKHPAQSVRLVAQRRLAERAADVVPALLVLLADKKAPAVARWSAIWTLDAIGGGAAGREGIVLALSDDDASVRRQAIRQLGNSGAKITVPQLVKLLTDADASIRFQAATALGHLGDKQAVEPLLLALAQTDLFARYAAFTALNRIGRTDSTVWVRIVKGLADTSPAIREGTAFALRETFDEALLAALRDFAADSAQPSAGRVNALKLLANLSRKPVAWDGKWWGTQPVKTPRPAHTVDWAGTALAAKAVRTLLNDTDADVRVTAVEAVATLGDAESTKELVAAFDKSTDAALKRAVLKSLAQMKSSAGAELIAKVLAKPTDNTAFLTDAVTAAGQIGGSKMIETLTEFAGASVPADALAKALEELGSLNAKAAVPTVAKHLTHTDAKVQAAAVGALAAIGGEPAVTALVPLLADKKADTRRTAVKALGAVRNRAAVSHLLKAYADAETKADAITALTATPDLRALDAYLDGLADKSAAMREACRTALGSIRGDALPLIEARLDKTPALTAAVVADLQRVYTVPVPVKSWRILGSFDEKAEPFKPGEPDLSAEVTDDKGKKVRWKNARVDTAGKVDLRRQGFSTTENVAAFAVTEVEAAAAGRVEMRAGSDDGLVVWVNGKKVFEKLGNGAYKADEFRIRADLKAGKNQIVAKITQGGGPWEFSIAVPQPGSGRLFKATAKVADPKEYAEFALKATGDEKHGQTIFYDQKGAACIKCHATGLPGAPGGEVGPSLMGVAAKYNRAQLIESVLYPSKQILDGYKQTRIVTLDGQTKLGIIRGETPTELTLIDADGKKWTIKKEDVDEKKELEKSSMPDDLHGGMSQKDFSDLIAFLESLKQKPPEKK